MPDFTTDERGQEKFWADLFDELGWVGKPGLHFLEVGCYEGRTTLWLVENVLTDPSSTVTVIDLFWRDDYTERFLKNLGSYVDTYKVIVRSGNSGDVLRQLDELFDFVYVDANHDADDVLTDAVLSFLLLKPGGVMVFDDYIWPGREDALLVKPAVDCFVSCFEPLIKHGQRGDDMYVVERL